MTLPVARVASRQGAIVKISEELNLTRQSRLEGTAAGLVREPPPPGGPRGGSGLLLLRVSLATEDLGFWEGGQQKQVWPKANSLTLNTAILDKLASQTFFKHNCPQTPNPY